MNVNFDVSNAHNKFDRHGAFRCVPRLVPTLAPRVRTSCWARAARVPIGRDGYRSTLEKYRGGDQGDALIR